MGTSGGVWGLEVGYCMMVGGPDEAVERLSPILDVLAPPSTEEHGPGWGHMGDTGAGHYVKMVHNGVEYGIMQAYAEGFELFDKPASTSSTTRRSRTSGCRARWSARGCASWRRCAFEQEGNDLARLEPYVEDSGEGRWTIEDVDRQADVPTPVITASLFERFYSRGQNAFAAKVIAALRNQFGGHAVKSRELMATVEQPNPLAEGLERLPVHPTTLTIFGATGDLGKRKLLPAHLQPRPRGRAAGALQPDRLLARRDDRRRVPRRSRGSRSRSSRAARPTPRCSTRCSRTCAT